MENRSSMENGKKRWTVEEKSQRIGVHHGREYALFNDSPSNEPIPGMFYERNDPDDDLQAGALCRETVEKDQGIQSLVIGS